MNNGTCKVFGDPKFGAILIDDNKPTLALPGSGGRYHTSGAQSVQMTDLADSATLRHANDATLRETFDAHIEGREPRFVQ